MRIDLTGPAKKKVLTLGESHGMTQLAIFSRLVEFFDNQDRHIQSAILDQDSKANVAAMILKNMTK
ncbi:MAG TPA: hypothetical protein VHD56_07040 [Tepidisphaeraceae bacterium]|nr:hypothetical protein [Tepidisphaeraceae bacterium]